MTAFQRFGHNIGEAWGNLIEGWRHLFQRAGRALRCAPAGQRDSDEVPFMEADQTEEQRDTCHDTQKWSVRQAAGLS